MLNYVELEKLIIEESYDKAESFCLKALTLGLDPRFWETQLGYVYFLNEDDDNARYTKSLEIFKDLVKKYPADANAFFWLGYLQAILLNDNKAAISNLQIVLHLDLLHPYANLVLAGFADVTSSILFLQRTLQQPLLNYRVAYQLASLFLNLKRKAEANDLLRRIISNEPYIERNYGVMNDYMNEVLTGSTNKQEYRIQAQSLLAEATN